MPSSFHNLRPILHEYYPKHLYEHTTVAIQVSVSKHWDISYISCLSYRDPISLKLKEPHTQGASWPLATRETTAWCSAWAPCSLIVAQGLEGFHQLIEEKWGNNYPAWFNPHPTGVYCIQQERWQSDQSENIMQNYQQRSLSRSLVHSTRQGSTWVWIIQCCNYSCVNDAFSELILLFVCVTGVFKGMDSLDGQTSTTRRFGSNDRKPKDTNCSTVMGFSWILILLSRNKTWNSRNLKPWPQISEDWIHCP